MSLIRSTDLSTTAYKNSNLYSLKGISNSSSSSAPLFNSEQRITCETESYSSDSYDPNYLLDSPTEEVMPPYSSSVRLNQFQPQGPSSCQLMPAQNSYNSSFVSMRHPNPCQTNFGPECLSPDEIDYDEDKMRMKLQELERMLLNDNDNQDDDMFGRDCSMDIDGEWVGPVHNVMLHDSPKESSSSDSIVSSISSNKVISSTTSRTPKQLLFDCASIIAEGHFEEASVMIKELRQRVSIQGDPPQRIAAYMVEALAARMATSGKGLYKALKCKQPPSSDRLSAMQVLFEVCPCFRFGFMAANGAILEALKGEKTVHIIDFDINQGSQYIALIQTLAAQPGKPPHLRLTGIDDPESVQRDIGGLKIIGQRLEKLAEDFDVSFEFRAVASMTSLVTPAMLDCQPGEALVVNFAFQLHHMPDESVSTVNQRDQLLRMVKSLKPKLVTVVEQEVNTNTTPFLTRFVESYNYYSAVFESLDATLPRESQERMNVEKQCLARDIVNIVACEGEERIERYEVAGKWRARMMMAGFMSCPFCPNVKDSIRKLIKQQYCDRYKMKEETGSLHFGWEDKVLIVASAWR
ncbi:scarecrow-like protein 1 [Cornus florida]|uniref:scarecrow-like protein 1 n=1 Tax=Cornus florida TaxID=4283 RepID=UPI00289ED292|nr:scarecrow-like protein 1 [Cornus florida]XP_059631676.1 scarecrow-like protein 1 [Cornus florida]